MLVTFENLVCILENNKYTAYIPRFQIVRMGVIRYIRTDWSLEELLRSLIVGNQLELFV